VIKVAINVMTVFVSVMKVRYLDTIVRSVKINATKVVVIVMRVNVDVIKIKYIV